jgi:hypothetical protein
MAERILHTDIEQRGKDTRIIDRLLHEITNNLQVITMEANLLLIFKREPRLD